MKVEYPNIENGEWDTSLHYVSSDVLLVLQFQSEFSTRASTQIRLYALTQQNLYTSFSYFHNTEKNIAFRYARRILKTELILNSACLCNLIRHWNSMHLKFNTFTFKF